MDHHPSENDNLFSETSQETIELVEALPQSRAFEQAMYKHRIKRTASFKDAASSKIHMPREFIMTSVPVEIRDSFLDADYEITDLEATLQDTPDVVNLTVLFTANGTQHSFESSRIAGLDSHQAIAFHETSNVHGDRVRYQVAPHTTTALLSSLAYAQQRFMDNSAGENLSLELDSTMVINRAEDISLAECIIMTLGNFSGRSRVETVATFDGTLATDPAILATLTEGEYPDKSMAEGVLRLSEIINENRLILASTELLQRQVTVEAGSDVIPAGTQSLRYATHEGSSLDQETPLFTQEIDPDRDPVEWLRICERFAPYATKAMRPYAYLDDY